MEGLIVISGQVTTMCVYKYVLITLQSCICLCQSLRLLLNPPSICLSSHPTAGDLNTFFHCLTAKIGHGAGCLGGPVYGAFGMCSHVCVCVCVSVFWGRLLYISGLSSYGTWYLSVCCAQR